jgi:hypothetical protein
MVSEDGRWVELAQDHVHLLFYYYYFSDGVRLSPLGTAASVWPIVPAPDDDDDECGVIDGKRIGRGNRRTRRKPARVPFCLPQIPRLIRARTLAAVVGNRRLTACAMARPSYPFWYQPCLKFRFHIPAIQVIINEFVFRRSCIT